MTADKQIAALKSAAEKVGGKLVPYSGRGMMGASCLAIVCDDPIDCLEAVASSGVTGGKQDAMGKQYVIYYPHLPA